MCDRIRPSYDNFKRVVKHQSLQTLFYGGFQLVAKILEKPTVVPKILGLTIPLPNLNLTNLLVPTRFDMGGGGGGGELSRTLHAISRMFEP